MPSLGSSFENKRAIFHETWITLDNVKAYRTSSFITCYITLSNNYKLKPVNLTFSQRTNRNIT